MKFEKFGWVPLLVLLFSALCCSCNTYRVFKKISSEEADFQTWTNTSGKSVVFIPMAHIGKREFYNNVNTLLATLRSEGYAVFYEGLKKNPVVNGTIDSAELKGYQRCLEIRSLSRDSITHLAYLLKLKRMTGILPDSLSLTKAINSTSILKSFVPQHAALPLYPSDSSLNVDLTLQELVENYEKRYGKIGLDQIDFALPRPEPLPSSLRLNKKNVRSIIIGSRDKYLAQTIYASSFPRIVVVYGMDHMKGTLAELKALDKTFTRKAD